MEIEKSRKQLEWEKIRAESLYKLAKRSKTISPALVKKAKAEMVKARKMYKGG